MTFKMTHAPYLRRGERASQLQADVLIALSPLCIFSAVYYGIRPVLLVLTGMIVAMLCETLGCLMMQRRPTVTDGAAAVTGGIVGVMVSPIAPYWLPAAAAAFAILIVKMPMGGNGRNLFNPAAAGLAAAALCFPGFMFRYPDPGQILAPLSLDNNVAGVIIEASPAALLRSGGQTLYTPAMLLLGDFPGPIGGTAIVILLACGLFLLVRRAISALITLPFLATCAAMAVLFPRVAGGAWISVMMELCSGVLLFCGVFLLNDPVTAPRHWLGRVGYGVMAGIFVMLLRYFGRFEEGAWFGVLLVNAFAPTLDRMGWYALNIRRRRKGRHAL